MRSSIKIKILATLLISTIVSTSLFFPRSARAGIAAGGVDCAAAAGAGAVISQLAGGAAAGVSAAVVAVAVPVSNPSIETTSATTAGATVSSTAWQSSFKGLADCMVYKLGQLMLDNLTEQTVNWIKGGMNGSPQFAVDPHKLYLDLSEAVAGNLARQLRGLELCEFVPNFKNDLANWVAISGGSGSEQKLKSKIECPFKSTTITASQFYSGQQKFLWNEFETALNDSGNPFGVGVLASNELTQAQQVEQKKAESEMNLANGFLGVTDTTACESMPPSAQEAIDTAIATRAADPTATVDSLGIPLFSESEINSYQRQFCKKVTPGIVIERQLSDALGTDMQRLGFADNLSKIIGALITKLSNDAITGVFKK